MAKQTEQLENNEVNTIAHLLEVEKKAAELTEQAQIEADKKIASAKAQADSEFTMQYTKLAAEFEKSYNDSCAELETKKQEQISSYKEKILASSKDSKSFESYLDSVLFA